LNYLPIDDPKILDRHAASEISNIEILIDSTMTDEVQEQWRDVEAWPGYAVSDQGRVRLKRGTVTLGGLERSGYMRVTFSGDGVKHYWVHRLVATAFIPNPGNKPEVNHLGAKTDNRASMLEWATPQENVAHANTNITVKPVRRVAQIDLETGEVVREYDKMTDADDYGFSHKNISESIKKGYQHGGYTWRYLDEPPTSEVIEGERWVRLADSIYSDVARFTSYEVSDHGRVRTPHRMRAVNKNTVSLSQDNVAKDFTIHRLMLMAFNVPNPEDKPEVDHIDSDHLNNRLKNLRWATSKENMNNPATRAKLAAATRRDTRWMDVTFPDQHIERILGIKAVVARVGISEATIRKYINDGGFGPYHRFQIVD